MARRKIFICYRRAHSEAARLLFDRAVKRFGRRRVFMDVHDISDSVDFPKVIGAEIRQSAAMIVVVGEGWATARTPAGAPKLARLDDPVRFEIREALSQDLPIFPVLVGAGDMPRADELPEDIRPFATRSGRRLPNDDLYEAAVDRLLTNVAERAGDGAARRWALPAAAAGLLLIAGLSFGALAPPGFFGDGSVEGEAVGEGGAAPEPMVVEITPGTDTSPNETPPNKTSPNEMPMWIAAPAQPEARAPQPAPPAGTNAESGSVAPKIVDCPLCPEIVVLPPGRFEMGSGFGPKDQKPKIERLIAAPFALGRYEVTEGEWRACEAAGACAPRATSAGDRPVAGITWRDATDYVAWLAAKTGRPYRLPTEIEWEYAAIVGEAVRRRGNYGEAPGPQAVGAFGADKAGLFDMIGNVWEWTSGCALPYDAAAFGGAAGADTACERVLRGGGWSTRPANATPKNRYAMSPGVVIADAGLRVARDLTKEELDQFKKERP